MDTGRLFKTIQDQGIPRSYSFCTSHYNSFPLRRTSKIRCESTWGRWQKVRLTQGKKRPTSNSSNISHRIHVAAIYSNIYHQYTPCMLAYIPYMDPMGLCIQRCFSGSFHPKMLAIHMAMLCLAKSLLGRFNEGIEPLVLPRQSRDFSAWNFFLLARVTSASWC